MRLDNSSWKNEYLKWYKLAEEALSGSIPTLDENEVFKFISSNNWLIIPAGDEKDKSESIARSDPNIYFNLGQEGKIHVQLVCNTLESVRRMRNVLHGFHTVDKENFINELKKLDGAFVTAVERKLKEYNPLQAPKYEREFEFPTNMMDDSILSDVFERIDKTMEESERIINMDRKRWRVLAPRLVIAEVWIARDESRFKEVLRKLKPAYQTALRIKTDEQIDIEMRKREKRKTEERQRRFREFVEGLKKKGVSGEEYRGAVSQWQRENP